MDQQNAELTLEGWKKKICDSYDAGTTPSYDDLEGALLAFIKDNQRMNVLINSMTIELNKIVVPRLNNESDVIVLAALDDFIKRRARVVKLEVVQKATVH